MAALSKFLYAGSELVHELSREPIALHCPVIENDDAPGRPMLCVMRQRLLIAFTVSVPWSEWFTPMLQPTNSALACAMIEADL